MNAMRWIRGGRALGRGLVGLGGGVARGGAWRMTTTTTAGTATGSRIHLQLQLRSSRGFTTSLRRCSDSPSSSSSSSSSPSSNTTPPTDQHPIKSYTYPEIKSLSLSLSPRSNNTLLIDVREPAEFSAGHIPTAKNLPIMSRPDAMFLPPDEFFDAFGFEKPVPAEGGEVVFYCKAGVRSRAAARMAREAGFRCVGEYTGSWLDWVENEERERDRERERGGQ